MGKAFLQYKSRRERIAERVAKLGPQLPEADRADAVALVDADEAERIGRQAVAGYDFTFSVPKSVSGLRAVADAGTQALIAQAHHAAIQDIVRLVEREVAATRVGCDGPDGGAVAQVGVTRVIATAYDHVDSRAGICKFNVYTR